MRRLLIDIGTVLLIIAVGIGIGEIAAAKGQGTVERIDGTRVITLPTPPATGATGTVRIGITMGGDPPAWSKPQQSREVSCIVGVRSVNCILPDPECCPDGDGVVWGQGRRFNIGKWPKEWKGKTRGATVWAAWDGYQITPVTGSCIERIRKKALELSHISARQDIDILTPPDCHHLSEERRHVAAKQR